MASKSVKAAMRILWEGEGRRWDDLFEYPYSEVESREIMKRLEATVLKLNTEFPNGIK